MRRFPALLWLPVYVGSLLILNGSHGRHDSLQLWGGIALTLLSLALAMSLAVGPWSGRRRPGGLLWFIAGVAAFYIVTGIAAWVFLDARAGIATLLAGVIPMTAAAIWVAAARSKTVAAGRGGDGEADISPEGHLDTFPGIGADDDRPLGDTPEAHDEVIPQDLPPDHPGRRAAETQAASRDGTTPGDREGGAAGVGGPEEKTRGSLVPRFERKDGARVRR